MSEHEPGRPHPEAIRHGELVVGADGLVRPQWATVDPAMQQYYDEEWGKPTHDERQLFERIVLETFQAGLSWKTILDKRAGFRAAFADFDPDAVAAFTERDVTRLLGDPGIVRNEAKIRATIDNAKATVALRKQGGLDAFIWSFQPTVGITPQRAADVPTLSAESTALAKGLRAKGFRFIGPTSAFAMMEAIGMIDTNLVGAHRRGTTGAPYGN